MIKEEVCYVAQDYDQELQQAQSNSTTEKRYTLPDDTTISVSQQRFQCPELIFNPTMFGRYEEGIHKHLHDSIMKCDNDIRKDLYKNIVLAGGSTMFQGLRERMKKEVQALASSAMTVDVDAPADRKHSCWQGGSVIS